MRFAEARADALTNTHHRITHKAHTHTHNTPATNYTPESYIRPTWTTDMCTSCTEHIFSRHTEQQLDATLPPPPLSHILKCGVRVRSASYATVRATRATRLSLRVASHACCKKGSTVRDGAPAVQCSRSISWINSFATQTSLSLTLRLVVEFIIFLSTAIQCTWLLSTLWKRIRNANGTQWLGQSKHKPNCDEVNYQFEKVLSFLQTVRFPTTTRLCLRVCLCAVFFRAIILLMCLLFICFRIIADTYKQLFSVGLCRYVFVCGWHSNERLN